MSDCVLWRGEGVTGIEAVLSDRYEEESVTERYLITLDSATSSISTVYATGIASGNTNPLPQRGEAWPQRPNYGLYAKRLAFRHLDKSLLAWQCDVSYLPLTPGEPPNDAPDDPLQWPATYRIDWVEQEKPIQQARNVEALGPDLVRRDANTLGPIVNGALQEYYQPQVYVARDAVVSITKNVATLDEAVARNVNFAGTTNSDTFLGAEARRARFLVAETDGLENANGIEYYAMTTRVQIEKTTDLILNNVGYQGYVGAFIQRFKDSDGEDVADPVFMKKDGTREEPGKVNTITYRYLDPVPYAPLVQ